MAKNLQIISYVILFAVGAQCLYEYYNEKDISFELPYATFIFVTLNGFAGSLLYTGEESAECEPSRLTRLPRFTEILIKTVGLPFFCTEIWLKYGVQEETAWLHVVVGVIYAFIYLMFDEKLCEHWLDTLVYLCCLSLGIVCFQNDNKYGMLSAVSFAIGSYILSNDPMDMSPEMLFNCLSAFFTAGAFFALSA